MPGFNHYPSCYCGWCVKPGSGAWRFRPFEPIGRPGSSPHEARAILKGYGAVSGYYACFVNPNATCPDCGAPVFYYENSRGSRVYFDDLGKPWPLHPCTKNKPVGVSKAITSRPAGHIDEIFYCRNISSVGPAAEFNARYGVQPSYVVMVSQCVRRGFENYIAAQPLVGDSDFVFLRFTSAKVIPAPGDLMSIKGEGVSLFIDEANRPIFKVVIMDNAAFENALQVARKPFAGYHSTTTEE